MRLQCYEQAPALRSPPVVSSLVRLTRKPSAFNASREVCSNRLRSFAIGAPSVAASVVQEKTQEEETAATTSSAVSDIPKEKTILLQGKILSPDHLRCFLTLHSNYHLGRASRHSLI